MGAVAQVGMGACCLWDASSSEDGRQHCRPPQFLHRLVKMALPPTPCAAENANDGFKPTSGHIDEISFRSTPEVRPLCAPGCMPGSEGLAEPCASAPSCHRRFCRQPLTRGSCRAAPALSLCVHAQVRSERPPWHLSVICGTVLRALARISCRSAEYLSYLEKGQLPPARISLTTLHEEFVLDGEWLAWPAVR